MDSALPRVLGVEELAGFPAARLMDVTSAIMAVLALPRSVGGGQPDRITTL